MLWATVNAVMVFNSLTALELCLLEFGVIDTTEAYYSGGCKGGFFWAAIMAIAEDFKRGFLAVPGSYYSTVLHRSIEFYPLLEVSRAA